jgi:hypothetical protein
LPEAELSAAYIELLITSLQKRGLDVHVLPLFHLLRMVARLAICNEVRWTSTHDSQLSEVMRAYISVSDYDP